MAATMTNETYTLRNECRDKVLSALHKQMRRRHKDSDWVASELTAVVEAANKFARRHAGIILDAPTARRLESRAFGSADYSSKWALHIADFVVGFDNR